MNYIFDTRIELGATVIYTFGTRIELGATMFYAFSSRIELGATMTALLVLAARRRQ